MYDDIDEKTLEFAKIQVMRALDWVDKECLDRKGTRYFTNSEMNFISSEVFSGRVYGEEYEGDL